MTKRHLGLLPWLSPALQYHLGALAWPLPARRWPERPGTLWAPRCADKVCEFLTSDGWGWLMNGQLIILIAIKGKQ